jgi:hypothetical protein
VEGLVGQKMEVSPATIGRGDLDFQVPATWDRRRGLRLSGKGTIARMITNLIGRGHGALHIAVLSKHVSKIKRHQGGQDLVNLLGHEPGSRPEVDPPVAARR